MDRLKIEWHRGGAPAQPAITLTFQYRTAEDAADVLSQLLETLVAESLAQLEARTREDLP
jgi:hypothetical protein